MIFHRYIAVFVLSILFSSYLPAQEMPDGFAYAKEGKLVFQVGPKEDFAVKAAAEGGSFFAVAIAAGMIEDLYYLALYKAEPQKADYIFEKQKVLPVTLTADGEKLSLGNNRSVHEKKIGKTKIEIMLVGIRLEDFEKIIAADKVYVEFGKIDHLLSAENLRAFHYLSTKMESDEDLRAAASAVPEGNTTIHVKGYYRKDGTYVKPHTRKRPSRPAL
jgi:hypothetical protein